MRKRRIPSPQRKTSSAEIVHRFVGISLSGGKADKACVAVLEYYPAQDRIFLARLYEKIKTEEIISADSKIIDLIAQFHGHVDYVAFDVPLSLPKHLLNCPAKCRSYETCTQPDAEYLRRLYADVHKGKKPKKLFTPYTQRPVDAYLAHKLEEKFEVHHALGSNLAPLTARAIYLSKRIKVKTIETHPGISVFRLATDLKVSKLHGKFHKHFDGGDESREIILRALAEQKNLFVYRQDHKSMIENNHAFESMICAYVGYLKFQGQTQARPKDFPAKEAWVELPRR